MDELAEKVIICTVCSCAAAVSLAALVSDGRWGDIGFALMLGLVAGGVMALSRGQAKALRAASVAPADSELSRRAVVLRPVLMALGFVLLDRLANDEGPGGALWFIVMLGVSSAISAHRLRRMQPPGQRFVSPAAWDYSGTVLLMPRARSRPSADPVASDRISGPVE